jgi:type VI secretion system secreted protein Hcp
MAVDGYMYFKHYKPAEKMYLESESQIDKVGDNEPLLSTFGGFKEALNQHGLFEVEDFAFGIEQTLNIGSQSTGAGAGRPTFNSYTVNRKIDRSSPKLLEMACSGTPFQEVGLALRKGGGGSLSGKIYLVFLFKLVAVKTINWSYDDESPKEAVEFDYGGLQVHYSPQKPDGNMDKVIAGGWNRVKNKQDTELKPIE